MSAHDEQDRADHPGQVEAAQALTPDAALLEADAYYEFGPGGREIKGLAAALRAALDRERETAKKLADAIYFHTNEHKDRLQAERERDSYKEANAIMKARAERTEDAEAERDALQWDIDRLKEELRQATRDAAKWQVELQRLKEGQP